MQPHLTGSGPIYKIPIQCLANCVDGQTMRKEFSAFLLPGSIGIMKLKINTLGLAVGVLRVTERKLSRFRPKLETCLLQYYFYTFF